MIAISLLTLAPGISGGSEVYARELVRSLAAGSGLAYRVLVPPVAPDAGGGLPTTVVNGYRGPRALALARAAADPRLARNLAGAEVVHYPLTVPVPRSRARTIVTLHDVQHRDLPRLTSRAQRAYRALAYDAAARHADRVVVISEFVRERAVERLGLDPGSVRITPLGLDHDVLRPGTAEREPFVYYPARPWPHKNHRLLFDALPAIRKAYPGLRLVLTGAGDFGRVPEGVEVLGHVPRAQVVGLLQRASALVFPSLYEGFGLPPLEAMACGCPVASSDAGSLPEVVGDAARLFDPRDPAAIAEAVLDVLGDPEPWVARGLERAKRFSWTETARATEAVYRELLP